MEVKVGSSSLELVEGDITRQDTEAIVNAANAALRPAAGWTAPSTGPAALPSRRRAEGMGDVPRVRPGSPPAANSRPGT